MYKPIYVPTTLVIHVHTHTRTHTLRCDTNTSLSSQITQRRLASAQLLSALWLPLCLVYLCTLTFAVKLRLTPSTTAQCQRSNLEFISTHKFQLNSLILRLILQQTECGASFTSYFCDLFGALILKLAEFCSRRSFSQTFLLLCRVSVARLTEAGIM